MSFIRDYMTFVERDEAHPNYHLWGCLVVIATLVGRKVWFRRAYQRVYANIYVILVGPQGNRKTAARDICHDFLAQVGGVAFACEATTREQLIKEMTQSQFPFRHNGVDEMYAPMTILATEFKEFLSIDPGRMINFLTAVYDRDYYDYSVRGRIDADVLTNPYLNILACETPDWLTDRLKERIVSGGFSRRVVYVYEVEHARFVDNDLTPAAQAARTRMLRDAIRFKNVVGELSFSPECQEFYNHWYLHPAPPPDPVLAGFYESKHTLATKIAMLVSLSESNSMIIEQKHFEGALGIISAAEKNMARVFVGSGRNELSHVAVKAYDVIEKAGKPVSEKQVLVHLFSDCRNAAERDDVIAHLVRSGKVVRYPAVDRWMLCAAHHVPKEVVEQLRRAAETKPGLGASSNQSSPPVVTPASTQVPQLEARVSPSAPSEESAPPR